MTFLVPAVLVAALGACDSVKAPPTARADQLPIENYPRQVVIDGLDRGIVTARAIVEPSTADRPMRVMLPVRSVVDKGLNIQYQFEFFDSAGRPLQPVSGQRFVHLEPRVQTHLEGNAMDTNAADWRVVIRPAR